MLEFTTHTIYILHTQLHILFSSFFYIQITLLCSFIQIIIVVSSNPPENIDNQNPPSPYTRSIFRSLQMHNHCCPTLSIIIKKAKKRKVDKPLKQSVRAAASAGDTAFISNNFVKHQQTGRPLLNSNNCLHAIHSLSQSFLHSFSHLHRLPAAPPGTTCCCLHSLTHHSFII